MENNVKISILLEIYGNLLTEKQRALLENYYNNGALGDLEKQGIKKDELQSLKDKYDNQESFKIEARKIMRDRMIRKTDSSLWNTDEAYYLEYEKDAILLRKGNEVWLLSGVDFSGEETRGIIREKLKLD